jgi:hypothetical protein
MICAFRGRLGREEEAGAKLADIVRKPMGKGGKCGLKSRKDFRGILRNAQVALRERAVCLVLDEGKTQAEAAQAWGPQT